MGRLFCWRGQGAASLNHPNIAAIHGLEEADGIRALVMELVKGEDLAQRLARGPVALDQVLEIGRQIAEALEAAHERGIVHRDLKPATVMLTREGQVKILDFGLAKAMAPAADSSPLLSQSPTITHQMTQAGMLLGTAAYMSPDQARGQEADKRADIWAFGVVLFELLTGESSFGGATISDTLAAVLTRDPDFDQLLEVPVALRRQLERCLEKDPRQRLRDIGEARIQLERLQSGELSDTPVAPVRRRRWHRWAISAALVAVGVSLGGILVSLREPPPFETPQVRLTVTPPGSGGEIQALELSRDGRRLVYQLASGAAPLFLHELNEFASRPVPGTEGASQPFFSPDGRRIGFFQGGKLRRVTVAGGDAVDICDSPEDSPGATWGPDNVIRFNPTWTQSGLWRVDALAGSPTELTKRDREKGETGHFWAHSCPAAGPPCSPSSAVRGWPIPGLAWSI